MDDVSEFLSAINIDEDYSGRDISFSQSVERDLSPVHFHGGHACRDKNEGGHGNSRVNDVTVSRWRVYKDEVGLGSTSKSIVKFSGRGGGNDGERQRRGGCIRPARGGLLRVCVEYGDFESAFSHRRG